MKATLIRRVTAVAALVAVGLLSTGTTTNAAVLDDAPLRTDVIQVAAGTDGTPTVTPQASNESTEAEAAGALVTVSPSAEYTEDPLGIGRVAWTQRCPASRFCTTQVGSGNQNIGFQFYRCTEYALTNWGVNGDRNSLVYNNQNVTVKYLNQRHAEIQSTPPGYFEIIDFKPVWYISLCN
ncbi:hypothetical protein ACFQVD_21640 [Streptosporangium amethystogenes subsp. fukuiense]|uniref:Secreted protein n=1 Tax=Streptosporangium amethystogenes subsp. fukuiense TaxID=698418 RepID=A0ABW2T233_9ACTN